jgi:50S ribosome-binding GTPase
VGLLDRLWTAVNESLFAKSGADASGDAEGARQLAQSSALVVWLLGKTGAGKTAIVSALTGDRRAEVGQGFAPCTRTSQFYDVPPEAPLLRFLDTRGLGEVGYDPASDTSWCEEQSHLMLVVMQVADPMQHVVLQPLQQARSRHAAETDRMRGRVRPLIYGCGAAAAGAGAVPLPMVGVGGLAGVIAMMLRGLAIRYGGMDAQHLQPVQRRGRWRCARVVAGKVWPA